MLQHFGLIAQAVADPYSWKSKLTKLIKKVSCQQFSSTQLSFPGLSCCRIVTEIQLETFSPITGLSKLRTFK